MNRKSKRGLILALLLLLCAFPAAYFFFFNSSSEDDKVTEDHLTDFMLENDVDSTLFEINSEADTIIFGPEGTAIYIDSGSFRKWAGENVGGPVVLELKEYYSMEDIMLSNLTTVSDDGVLQTGGMINLTAKSGEDQLELIPGKEINVHFPKNGNTVQMDFYSGAVNSQDKVEWRKKEITERQIKDDIIIWYTKHEGLDNKRLYLADGTDAYDWIKENMVMTDWEQEYVMFKDVDLLYTVNKSGKMVNLRFERDYDRKFTKRMMKIAKNFPTCKAYTIGGLPIDMEGHFAFGVEIIPPSHAKNKNYLEEIEKGYPEFEKQSISSLDKAELHYYIFNSAQLGWMNVDKLIDDPAPKIEMELTVDEPQNVMVKLVYKEYKAVIPAKFIDKTHYFRGIPEGKDITLFLIKSGKKKVEVSFTEMKTKAGKITFNPLKEMSMGDLKKELAKLN